MAFPPDRAIGFVGDVRGRGLLCAVEIVTDKESRTPDAAKALAIYGACMARGLRTRNLANSLAFSPPLVINKDDSYEIVRILGPVLDTL